MSDDSEEERVLAFMREQQEGASYFAVTTELGMARTRAVSILEQLHRDGKLTFDCKTKLYFSAPERDRLAAYERRVDAGEIPAPDPELDRAAPDRFPLEERPSNKCQYCGKVVEKYLWQHENYCKENPNRKLPPGVKAERKRAGSSDAPAAVMTDRTNDIKEEPVSEPPQPEDPAPIDENVLPADPLALFAQQHRLRVNKEIRKLRKVEGKLRRRAAAAVAMADRVNAARRTKERELRRFEKELGEVSS